MARSRFTEFSDQDRRDLLRLARRAIAEELGMPGQDAAETRSRAMVLRRGVFVTLTRSGTLRGCIGTLEGDRPLELSVPDCARGAAFRDPRFPSLDRTELEEVCVEISVLTEPEPLAVTSREDLLAEVRPGIDGLVIEETSRRATFLPQVWDQLAAPEDFLSHLLRKAGLPGDYWSERLRCSRYQCIKFTEVDHPPA